MKKENKKSGIPSEETNLSIANLKCGNQSDKGLRRENMGGAFCFFRFETERSVRGKANRNREGKKADVEESAKFGTSAQRMT